MRFDVNLQELRTALNIVKDTIGTNADGHEGIRLYVSKKTNRIKLTTNGGSGYFTETWIDASVKEGGKAIVKAKKFIQYIFKLNAEKVSISTAKNGAVVVKVQRGQQSFNGYDEAGYQDIPEYKAKDTFSLAGRVYKQLISGISFAAQENKNRPVLEGINITSDGTYFEVSAMNGISMAHFKKKIKAPVIDVTVAKKSLVNAIRAIKDDDKVMIQVCDGTHVVLRVEDTSYHMPLLAGKFPNLKSVIPKKVFPLEVTVDKEDILDMLDRATTMLDTKGNLQFDAGRITLTGEGADGRFEEFIMANMEGKAKNIGLDLKRFMEVIKHIDADSVVVGVEDGKPIAIRPETRAQHTCLIAIMPAV